MIAILLALAQCYMDEEPEGPSVLGEPPSFNPDFFRPPVVEEPIVSDDKAITFPMMESRTCREVCTRFNNEFPRKGSDPCWSGSASTCDVGTHKDVDIEDGLRRLNLYRWLVGMTKSNVTSVASKNEMGRYCAMIMDANSDLSHSPPKTWKCWTQAGSTGAGVSNIAWYQNDAAYAVRTYIEDREVVTLGHRRWLLYPALLTVGIGQRRRGNCMQIISNDYTYRESIPFVAYPPPGPFPISEVFAFWSFASEVNMKEAKVTIVRNDGVNVPCKVDARWAKTGSYGQSTILIRDLPKNLVAAGYSYKVTVNQNGTIWEYTSRLVDCSKSCPAEPSTTPGTSTPSASRSATPTASRSATPTASRSATPTASRSATPTASRSATPTASRSATPTASRSATPTASRSPTMTPTATPDPCAAECKKEIAKVAEKLADQLEDLMEKIIKEL